GDGKADIIVGEGAGGTPLVKVFNGATGAEVREFLAYDVSFKGGVNVAGADLNADGKAEIITGAGAGGGPHVKVFDGLTNNLLSSFFGLDSTFAGGARVAAYALDAAGHAGIAVAPGVGTSVQIKVFNTNGSQPLAGILPFGTTFTGGAFISASGLPSGLTQLA